MNKIYLIINYILNLSFREHQEWSGGEAKEGVLGRSPQMGVWRRSPIGGFGGEAPKSSIKYHNYFYDHSISSEILRSF